MSPNVCLFRPLQSRWTTQTTYMQMWIIKNRRSQFPSLRTKTFSKKQVLHSVCFVWGHMFLFMGQHVSLCAGCMTTALCYHEEERTTSPLQVTDCTHHWTQKRTAEQHFFFYLLVDGEMWDCSPNGTIHDHFLMSLMEVPSLFLTVYISFYFGNSGTFWYHIYVLWLYIFPFCFLSLI